VKTIKSNLPDIDDFLSRFHDIASALAVESYPSGARLQLFRACFGIAAVVS
jgi:hypothetical protein